jgi:hypothetical protein
MLMLGYILYFLFYPGHSLSDMYVFKGNTHRTPYTQNAHTHTHTHTNTHINAYTHML